MQNGIKVKKSIILWKNIKNFFAIFVLKYSPKKIKATGKTMVDI